MMKEIAYEYYREASDIILDYVDASTAFMEGTVGLDSDKHKAATERLLDLVALGLKTEADDGTD
jgi:hypothetical protein